MYTSLKNNLTFKDTKMVKIAFDLGIKELRVLEDISLQDIIDIVKEFETDFNLIKIKTHGNHTITT